MLIAHNYIGGQWLKPSGVLTIGDSMNPATGEKAAQFVAASVQEVDAAIASARRAFESTTWAQQPKLRADVLRLLGSYRSDLLGFYLCLLVHIPQRPALMV